mmetsp:Transcript_2937/g.11963  ORF Transcript_2937/g.11963 Transcript_2937/m.11963 type:complete len:242 (+) Transcript_2937:2773-3498(+)
MYRPSSVVTRNGTPSLADAPGVDSIRCRIPDSSCPRRPLSVAQLITRDQAAMPCGDHRGASKSRTRGDIASAGEGSRNTCCPIPACEPGKPAMEAPDGVHHAGSEGGAHTRLPGWKWPSWTPRIEGSALAAAAAAAPGGGGHREGSVSCARGQTGSGAGSIREAARFGARSADVRSILLAALAWRRSAALPSTQVFPIRSQRSQGLWPSQRLRARSHSLHASPCRRFVLRGRAEAPAAGCA